MCFRSQFGACTPAFSSRYHWRARCLWWRARSPRSCSAPTMGRFLPSKACLWALRAVSCSPPGVVRLEALKSSSPYPVPLSGLRSALPSASFWVRRPFPPKPSSSSASYRSYRSRFCLRSSESVPLCPNQKMRRSNPTSRRRIASQDAFFWGRCSSVWRQGSCRRTDPTLEWMRRRRFPSRSCSSSCSALPLYSSSEARGPSPPRRTRPPRRRDARRYLARCRLRPGR